MQAKVRETGEIYQVVRFENILTPKETVILLVGSEERAYPVREVEIV